MRSTKYNVHGWVSVNGNDVCTCFGPKRRFFPAHTQAVPFAYEMHSGDENVKEGATHSATHYNAEMRESFQRSAPHPWALATWKLKLAKCDAGQLSIPRQSYLKCCEHKRSFNFDRLGLPNALGVQTKDHTALHLAIANSRRFTPMLKIVTDYMKAAKVSVLNRRKQISGLVYDAALIT